MDENQFKGEVTPSYCVCGHVGDAMDTDHKTYYQPGHGDCTYEHCGCQKFTWLRFLTVDEWVDYRFKGVRAIL